MLYIYIILLYIPMGAIYSKDNSTTNFVPVNLNYNKHNIDYSKIVSTDPVSSSAVIQPINVVNADVNVVPPSPVSSPVSDVKADEIKVEAKPDVIVKNPEDVKPVVDEPKAAAADEPTTTDSIDNVKVDAADSTVAEPVVESKPSDSLSTSESDNIKDVKVSELSATSYNTAAAPAAPAAAESMPAPAVNPIDSTTSPLRSNEYIDTANLSPTSYPNESNTDDAKSSLKQELNKIVDTAEPASDAGKIDITTTISSFKPFSELKINNSRF